MVSMDAREFVARASELDPRSFERMAFEALQASGRFSDLKTHVRMGTVEADLTARENLELGSRLVAVEIKHRRALDVGTVRMFIGLREALRRADPTYDFIVIVSGLLTTASRREAQVAGLEIWDGATLASFVPPAIQERYLGSATTHQPAIVTPPRGSAFSDALTAVTPGKRSGPTTSG